VSIAPTPIFHISYPVMTVPGALCQPLYYCQWSGRNQPSRCSWWRVVGFRHLGMWLWSSSKRTRRSATCWTLFASHQHGGTIHCNTSRPCALPVYHKPPVSPLTCPLANFLQLAPLASSVKSSSTQPRILFMATSKLQSYALVLSLIFWPPPLLHQTQQPCSRACWCATVPHPESGISIFL